MLLVDAPTLLWLLIGFQLHDPKQRDEPVQLTKDQVLRQFNVYWKKKHGYAVGRKALMHYKYSLAFYVFLFLADRADLPSVLERECLLTRGF